MARTRRARATAAKQRRRRAAGADDTNLALGERVQQVRRLRELLRAEPTPAALPEIRKLALHDGLFEHGVRRRCWPLLLGIHERSKKVPSAPPHRDVEQVDRDVERSLFRQYPNDREREIKRKQLTRIVNGVLVAHPDLYYYQGFHDICAVFMQVVPDELAAFELASATAVRLLRPMMQSNFTQVKQMLDLTFPLLRVADPDLHAFVAQSGVDAVAVVTWLITWNAHDCEDLQVLARLFDFFLAASNPLMPLYVAIELLVRERDQILAVECDYAQVHTTISRVAKGPIGDIDALLSAAWDLFRACSPDQLRRTAGQTHGDARKSGVRTPLLQAALVGVVAGVTYAMALWASTEA